MNIDGKWIGGYHVGKVVDGLVFEHALCLKIECLNKPEIKHIIFPNVNWAFDENGMYMEGNQLETPEFKVYRKLNPDKVYRTYGLPMGDLNGFFGSERNNGKEDTASDN